MKNRNRDYFFDKFDEVYEFWKHGKISVYSYNRFIRVYNHRVQLIPLKEEPI